jgi:hypothetical protein
MMLGRFSRVDFLWQGEVFTVICVYTPTNHLDRKVFFAETLLPHLQKHPPSDQCFIGGDFNFVENPALDRTSMTSGGIATGITEWSEIAES